MAGFGYSKVTDKAFSAFAYDLSEGAWKDISIKKYVDAADRKPPTLLDAPRPAVWKLRATWAITDIALALGVASAEVLAQLDRDWDAAQRSFNSFNTSALDDADPEVRAAAERIGTVMLDDGGTAQTGWGYEDEVDFGRNQILVAAQEPVAADLKKLGAQKHLKRIAETTEALAKGLGRGPGEKRAPTRSKQIREAMRACTTTFNVIHEDLEWLIDHTPPGKQRDELEKLHAPFLALLERHPGPEGSTGAPEEQPPQEPAKDPSKPA